MKNIAAVVILFLGFILAWNMFATPDVSVDFDGEHLDGPLGALAGLLFAGGGLLIGALATLFVGVVLAVVFAGLGILLVAALSLGAVILAALMAPFLLPVLIPLAIIWFIVSRSRRNRAKAQAV